MKFSLEQSKEEIINNTHILFEKIVVSIYRERTAIVNLSDGLLRYFEWLIVVAAICAGLVFLNLSRTQLYFALVIIWCPIIIRIWIDSWAITSFIFMRLMGNQEMTFLTALRISPWKICFPLIIWVILVSSVANIFVEFMLVLTKLELGLVATSVGIK